MTNRHTARYCACLLLLTGFSLSQGSPQGQRFVTKAEAALKTHPYFSKIRWEWREPVAGLLVLIQQAPDADPGYAKRVSATYARRVKGLRKELTQLYAKPLEIPLRGPVAFAHLASEAEYKRYVKSMALRAHDRFHYDPHVRLAVTWMSSPKPKEKIESEATRRVYCYALLHLLANQRLPLSSLLIREGVSEMVMSRVSNPGTKGPNPKAFRCVAELCEHPRLLETMLRHPLEMLRYDDEAQVIDAALVRCTPKSLGLDRRSYIDLAFKSFRAQAELFLYFLHFEQDGKLRPAETRWVEALLDGEPKLKAFLNALGAGVSDAYFNWLLTTCFEQFGARLAPPALAGKSAAKQSTDDAATAFQPQSLEIPTGDTESWLAIIRAQARSGHLTQSLATADRLIEANPASVSTARLVRERKRVAATATMRRAFLETAARKRWSLRAPDGKLAKLVKIKGTMLELKRGRKVLKMDREEIPVADLLSYMKRKRVKPPSPWIGSYAQLLSKGPGETRKRKIRGKSEAARSLRSDLKTFPIDSSRSEIASTLHRLAKSPLPKTAADAQQIVNDIASLMKRKHRLIDARRPKLALFARIALSKTFNIELLCNALGGRFQALKGGRVRLSYDFSQATQLKDFTPDKYMEEERKRIAGIPAIPGKLRVDGGHLVLNGRLAAHHLLELATPLTIDLRVKLNLAQWDAATFFLGFCDDRHGRFAFVRDLTILGLQRPGSFMESAPKEIIVNRDYALRIHHDGKLITLFLDGKKCATMDGSLYERGALFLWAHATGPVHIDDLKIEGGLDEIGRKAAGQTWVEQQLHQLGF